LIHVELEVHELQLYETQWFPCDKCHAHDVASGQDVTRCAGKVLLRCGEKDQVVEVDNLCTAAEHKKKNSDEGNDSLLQIDKSDLSISPDVSVGNPSKSFLQHNTTKKARSGDAATGSSRTNRRHEA
jgi:hypothetical protein